MDPGWILEALVNGLSLVFSWPVFGYLLAGISVGMVLGVLPGLSGLTGMALLLPFAFGRAPAEAFALLLGMYAVTTITDTIPAVLLGVPGTSASLATVIDGFAMAKRGQAGRALGASYLANIIGAAVGGIILTVFVLAVRPIINTFGAGEFFMLAILGLVMVGSLSGRSVLKGIVAAALGLLISMIGQAPQSPEIRYSFGQLYLWSGIPLEAAVIALFGVPEMIELAVRRTSISRVPISEVSGTLVGLKDCLRHWWLTVRCAALGAAAGFIPALGGPVAEWFGYGHAVQSARDKGRFGQGDVRGVIGPEAATGGQKPGALIPTITFAIPGNASMAILLGAFLIVGLRPGISMLTTNLDITFAMVWFIVLGNIIAALLCIGISRQLALLTFVRGELLIPFIVGFMAVGAIAATGSFGDLVVFAVFGLLGWGMSRTGWSRSPLVLGMVLGPLLENNLFIALDAYGVAWLWRPWVLVLWAGIFASLYFGYKQSRRELDTTEAGRALGGSTAQA